MLETFHDTLLTNDDILLFAKVFGKITFFANEMSIFTVDPDKINLADNKSVDKDHPETIIYVRLLVWHNKFEKRKAQKDKSKELIPRAWHSTRWEKGIELIFTDKAGR